MVDADHLDGSAAAINWASLSAIILNAARDGYRERSREDLMLSSLAHRTTHVHTQSGGTACADIKLGCAVSKPAPRNPPETPGRARDLTRPPCSVW